ncbi:MAG: PspA/IM30 family protein [Gammaproteobacteria bacterium]
MNVFDTFTLMMRSNITVLCEKFNDPEKSLNQLIIDMEEELDRARHRVAGAIADEIQLGKQVERHRSEVKTWLERASRALDRGDEQQAKGALEQKLRAEKRANDLETEHRKQKLQVDQLQEAIRDLEDKIRQARQKHTLLLARLARAESQESINRALSKTASKSAFAQFQRFEARVDRAEAMSQAYDRLDGVDPDAMELERQFEASEREEQLNRELELLKKRVGDDAE